MGLFFKRKKEKQDVGSGGNTAEQGTDLRALSSSDASEPSKKSKRSKRRGKPHRMQEPALDLTQRLDDDLPMAQIEDEPKEPVILEQSQVLEPVVAKSSTGDPTRDAVSHHFDQLRRIVKEKNASVSETRKTPQAPVAEDRPLDLTDVVASEDEHKKSFFKKFSKKDRHEEVAEDGGVLELKTPLDPVKNQSAPKPDEAPTEVETEEEFQETKEQRFTTEVTFGNVETAAVEVMPIAPAPQTSAPEPEPQPVRFDDLIEEIEGASIALPSAWLGLWVSEDGRSFYIEADEDGELMVSAMPDPMSKCYFGPDYPEIETWRMPADFSKQEISGVMGERIIVNSVPGLPSDHQAPLIYLYFLVNLKGEEGEGTRFATDGDNLTRVYLVAESEEGTVNPWGDGDEILWLGEPANFYKAPAKLDAYMERRVLSDDPSNHI